MYETIAGLHTIAGKQAMKHINETDIVELSQINSTFQTALLEKNTKKTLQLDVAFHNKIVAISKNTYIEPFLANLHLHVLRLEYIFFQALTPAKQSIEEHHFMIKALQEKDEEKLEKNDHTKLVTPNERNSKHHFYKITKSRLCRIQHKRLF